MNVYRVVLFADNRVRSRLDICDRSTYDQALEAVEAYDDGKGDYMIEIRSHDGRKLGSSYLRRTKHIDSITFVETKHVDSTTFVDTSQGDQQ